MRTYLTPARRRWIYGISLAVVPLLVLYGIVDEQSAPLWIALVSAIVVPGLAVSHVNPED